MAYLPKFSLEPDDFYSFHKSPDGEDCLEKTFYYTKYTTIAGSIFSFLEMVVWSKPSTLPSVIARFGRFTLPSAAMGMTFGASLCILGQLRKKTDVTNHFLAGAAAGTVWGAKYRSVSVGHHWAVFLAVFSGYYMYFKVNNLNMLTYQKPEHRTNRFYTDLTIKIYDDPGRPDTM